MQRTSAVRRSWTFCALAAFFTLFVRFLYGPMSAIYILSFQGPTGGLTFPMNGVSLDWFVALFGQQRTGDFGGSFTRPMAAGVKRVVKYISVGCWKDELFRMSGSRLHAKRGKTLRLLPWAVCTAPRCASMILRRICGIFSGSTRSRNLMIAWSDGKSARI